MLYPQVNDSSENQGLEAANAQKDSEEHSIHEKGFVHAVPVHFNMQSNYIVTTVLIISSRYPYQAILTPLSLVKSQSRSQASPAFVLWFAFSIIHRSGRAAKIRKGWEHSSHKWRQMDTRQTQGRQSPTTSKCAINLRVGVLPVKQSTRDLVNVWCLAKRLSAQR